MRLACCVILALTMLGAAAPLPADDINKSILIAWEEAQRLAGITPSSAGRPEVHVILEVRYWAPCKACRLCGQANTTWRKLPDGSFQPLISIWAYVKRKEVGVVLRRILIHEMLHWTLGDGIHFAPEDLVQEVYPGGCPEPK